MTKPSPEIEAKARERLAADEQRIAQDPAALGTHHRLPAYLPVARRGLGRLLAAPLPLADRQLPGRLVRLPGHARDVRAGPS